MDKDNPILNHENDDDIENVISSENSIGEEKKRKIKNFIRDMFPDGSFVVRLVLSFLFLSAYQLFKVGGMYVGNTTETLDSVTENASESVDSVTANASESWIPFIENSSESLVPFTENTVEKWMLFTNNINMVEFGVFFFLIFCVASLFRAKFKNVNTDSWFLLVSEVLIIVASLWRTTDYLFGIGTAILCGVLLLAFTKPEDFSALTKINKKIMFSFVAIISLAVAGFVAFNSILQYYCLQKTGSDFGVYYQLYHYMVSDFSTTVTVGHARFQQFIFEHFSPIHYLLFPIFYLFPKGETLLICQAFIAVSGVIPTCLLANRLGYSTLGRVCVDLIYVFSTGITIGCYYDFHENFWLAPLIMWLIYTIKAEKNSLSYVFLVLLLMVKEDAAIYAICISIYLIFQKEKRLKGANFFLISVGYFAITSYLMAEFGEGHVYTASRFGNLMTDQSAGLDNIFITVLKNPMYYISQCFSEDMYLFFIQMFVPLLFVPLATRKGYRFFLLIPLVFLNLAPSYPYLHNIKFQYVFGTTALLVALFILNLKDWNETARKYVLPLSVMAVFCSFLVTSTYQSLVWETWKDNKDWLKPVWEMTEKIPKDASVTSDVYLSAILSDRDEVYYMEILPTDKAITTDYIVFYDHIESSWISWRKAECQANGYVLWDEVPGKVSVYQKE
ncbi:MAG: DUF2079 domain-containing protein [Ruminococcus sp.]|jgi:uncharacterized membrane protein|nr:DUF2079 domain-containing protein [Ruminococcus sp.]